MSTTTGRSSVRFAGEVDPGDTETLEYDLPEAATVTELRIRIYEGPQLDLHITPYAERGDPESRRDRTPLITTVGKDYVDGEDDDWVFHVNEDLDRLDSLVIEAENKDPTHPYNFAVQATLSRGGGR